MNLWDRLQLAYRKRRHAHLLCILDAAIARERRRLAESAYPFVRDESGGIASWPYLTPEWRPIRDAFLDGTLAALPASERLPLQTTPLREEADRRIENGVMNELLQLMGTGVLVYPTAEWRKRELIAQAASRAVPTQGDADKSGS